jgi:hypothetical protein
MSDITGSYTMNGRPGYKALQIVLVDAAGRLDAALVDDQNNTNTIHGTYDDVMNQIMFNDASYPGETLFTNFFVGSAIFIPGSTVAFALAGTWSEARIQILPGRKLQPAFDRGSWYADCKQLLIQ